MSNMTIGFGAGVLAGVLATLIVQWWLSRPPRPVRTSVAPISPDEGEIAELRQNLRLKVMYDEEKIERLIDAERQRTPGAGLAQLMRGAIERLERENR